MHYVQVYCVSFFIYKYQNVKFEESVIPMILLIKNKQSVILV